MTTQTTTPIYYRLTQDVHDLDGTMIAGAGQPVRQIDRDDYGPIVETLDGQRSFPVEPDQVEDIDAIQARKREMAGRMYIALEGAAAEIQRLTAGETPNAQTQIRLGLALEILSRIQTGRL